MTCASRSAARGAKASAKRAASAPAPWRATASPEHGSGPSGGEGAEDQPAPRAEGRAATLA